jgi:hypothetical protein
MALTGGNEDNKEYAPTKITLAGEWRIILITIAFLLSPTAKW